MKDTGMGGTAPSWAEIATAIVAVVGAASTLGSYVFNAVINSKISKTSEALHKDISKASANLHTKVEAQRVELLEAMAEDHEQMRRDIVAEGKNFGESLAAIREHLAQMGFFIRDNFVRRDEFQTAMLQLNQSIDTLRDSNDKKLEGIRAAVEAKLDKVAPVHTR